MSGTVATTVRVAVSTSETSPPARLTTATRVPSGDAARASGPVPTGIVASTSPDPTSSTETTEATGSAT